MGAERRILCWGTRILCGWLKSFAACFYRLQVTLWYGFMLCVSKWSHCNYLSPRMKISRALNYLVRWRQGEGVDRQREREIWSACKSLYFLLKGQWTCKQTDRGSVTKINCLMISMERNIEISSKEITPLKVEMLIFPNLSHESIWREWRCSYRYSWPLL